MVLGAVGLIRALKQETAKLGTPIAVVVPAIMVTPTECREAGKIPANYAAEMAKKGVPINKAESIALVVCWLFS